MCCVLRVATVVWGGALSTTPKSLLYPPIHPNSADMPSKRTRSSKQNRQISANKKGKHTSDNSKEEEEEVKAGASSSSTTDAEKPKPTRRYQLDPSEFSPRLIDLQGNVFLLPSVGDTVTLQGVELTIQEASPEKCRLFRASFEDRDQQFAEAKEQLQEEINKRQEDIGALEAQSAQLFLRIQEDIDNADHLATQLGIY